MEHELEYIEITKTEFLNGLNEMVRQGQLSTAEANKKQIEAVIEIQKCALAKKHGMTAMPSPKQMKALKTKQNRIDVAQLRENMVAADRNIPKGCDAHHIVASNDFRPYAAIWVDRAQSILRRWGIDINDEANGVALPSSETTKIQYFDDCPSPSHKKVHTKKYYMNVANDLQGVGSRDECIELLQEIGEDLEDGSYEW